MVAAIKRLPIPEKYLAGLDPEFVKLWEEHGAYTVRADERPVEDYRADPGSLSFTYATWTGPGVHKVQDHKVTVTDPDGEITVRVYTPEGTGPFPVHINTHGGGWVVGGLASEQAWCKEICNRVSCVVVDVDYRLSPEVRFPTAIYDSWTAVKWTIAKAQQLNINPKSVSIGGLSAGGHMSAVMAHFAREEGIELKLQLLVVGAFDLRHCPPTGRDVYENTRYPSFVKYKDVPWGPYQRLQWFMDYWCGTDEKVRQEIFNDWRCSPVLAPSFENLAPAFIVTAEFDPGRDEEEYYGELLRRGGNRVEVKQYKGMPHAFGHYNHPERGLTKSREYIKDTAAVIAKAHGLV